MFPFPERKENSGSLETPFYIYTRKFEPQTSVIIITGLNKLQLYVLALKMALDADRA